jgi:hypothetical protein
MTLVLSRQVWYMDPVAALKTRQCKEDVRVLKKAGYEVVSGRDLSDDELHRAVELYNCCICKSIRTTTRNSHLIC